MSIKLKPIDQQVIVITGASSGIGMATAISAYTRGAKLVLAGRSERALGNLVRQLNDGGGKAIFVKADVADRAQVEKIADAAIHEFGRIDTWINDSGISIYGHIWEVSEEDNRRLFDTNFWGVVNGSLVALEHLRANGGALINVGSEVSESVVPLQGMYSASKHAVKGFTDVLRVELEIEKAPVSVTLIQPTAVNTPFPQNAKNYMSKEPKLLDPMIDPQQVADAILDAAKSPARDVKVGMMATINTAFAKFAPCIGDKMSARMADKQHYDMPPKHPDGALYKPSESAHIHGHAPTR